MISDKTKESLRSVFERALRTSLLSSIDHSVKIAQVPDVSHFSASQAVILSISSYFFRMVVVIYFTPDERTKAHFASINKLDAATMGSQSFIDTICECGNICCGSVNRDLSRIFPQVGMSTPNIVDAQCARHLNVLGSSHQLHLDIAIPDGPCFHASLCVTEFENLDFDIAEPEEESNGELEMF